MAYVYRGTVRDIEEEVAPTIPRKLTSFDDSACGTNAGYNRHRKHGVPACRPCKDAQAAYHRDRYQRKPKAVFSDDACGTWAGYQRHAKIGIEQCEPCLVASRAYQKQWRDSRKAA
jgi:hypothetical protein